tara:strand:+ start:327 stop:503 length:177 start_codon:yes stop_codon:yes gene_type:complete
MKLNPIMIKSETGQFIINTMEEFLQHTDITHVPTETVNKVLYLIQESNRIKEGQVKSL